MVLQKSKLRKELNYQVRYMEPRELGTITRNPQTMETFAVLNLLLRFSCLKAQKTLGTRREVFLFPSLYFKSSLDLTCALSTSVL